FSICGHYIILSNRKELAKRPVLFLLVYHQQRSNIVCIYNGRKFLREKPAWRTGFSICWSGPANGMV
ncbi:MAG: hypothetical protein J5904_05385, partial [Anaerovibrio sp.]|nr:hypothetical protein [Anaerovibrio sp.]